MVRKRSKRGQLPSERFFGKRTIPGERQRARKERTNRLPPEGWNFGRTIELKGKEPEKIDQMLKGTAGERVYAHSALQDHFRGFYTNLIRRVLLSEEFRNATFRDALDEFDESEMFRVFLRNVKQFGARTVILDLHSKERGTF